MLDLDCFTFIRPNMNNVEEREKEEDGKKKEETTKKKKKKRQKKRSKVGISHLYQLLCLKGVIVCYPVKDAFLFCFCRCRDYRSDARRDAVVRGEAEPHKSSTVQKRFPSPQ